MAECAELKGKALAGQHIVGCAFKRLPRSFDTSLVVGNADSRPRKVLDKVPIKFCHVISLVKHSS